MLSKFKLHTLQQKLWAIVATSFVARVITFSFLPNSATSLAPDEGTYAALTKWVALSRPADEFPNFGSLYLTGRSIILPASALFRLGFSELDSIRLASTIYGFLSLVVIVFLCSRFFQSVNYLKNNKKNVENLVLSLVFLYAFIPSHFLWSSLGLRESANEFWLIITFVGVLFFYKARKQRKIYFLLLISISIVGTFSSRPQVGWVLVVSLFIYSLFRLRDKLTYFLVLSVAIGLFAGYFFTTSLDFVTRDVYVIQESTGILIDRDKNDISKFCDGVNPKVEYQGKTYTCVKSGTVTKLERASNLTEVAIEQIEVLPGKQLINQVGAASMINRLPCPWDETSEIGKYGCLAFRAPYMAMTFLFRPLPILDTTSISSVFASAENMLWVFLFALIFYRICKVRGVPFFVELAPSMIFFSLYVIGAGSYEGNMGTAFRHKSLILWVALLALFALSCRKTETSEQNSRNNSQVGAV
jgi:hypothetical protein